MNKFYQNLYDGNICIDLLAKDGSECLYLNIQIIENNGILFQMYSKLSLDFYEEQTPNITFNSKQEMISKLRLLLSGSNSKEISNFFIKKFNEKEFSFQIIQKLFNLI